MSIVARKARRRRPALRIATLLMAIAGSCSGAARAAETPESLYDQAVTAAWWGELDDLQKMYDRARKSTARSPDGERDLDMVRRGFARLFGNSEYNEAYHAQVDAITRQWAEANPQSSMAHVLHARALYAHAWFLRGGGYASEVTPQGWEGFRKYMAMAEGHLAKNAAVVMTDSSAHLYLVMIGRSLERSFEAQWAIAQESFRVDPEDDAILAELTISALPKWGGSANQIERVARDAVAKTQAKLGFERYAQVYMTAAYEFKGGLFNQTRADWPTMKQGFRDVLSRYPGPVPLNRFAYAACLAQDKVTAIELLERIGDKPVHFQWGGKAAYETCRRWARTS
jgi:hypothetical protein